MKSLMRERVWWQGMSIDIASWVEKYQSCTMAARPERPVPMRRSVLPLTPWESLAIDYNGKHADCGGRMIIVLVDYFIRFLVAEFIRSTDIGSLVVFLETTFSVLGYPKSIRSDNGPPFNGEEWRQ